MTNRRTVYQSICRLGGGFSDSLLQQITTDVGSMEEDELLQDQLAEYYYYCEEDTEFGLKTVQGQPIWLPPGKLGVWEVQASDFSLSLVHNAGAHLLGNETKTKKKGLALRFPRFVRVRQDKHVVDATSARSIVDMAFPTYTSSSGNA
jgi:DNA ligase-1